MPTIRGLEEVSVNCVEHIENRVCLVYLLDPELGARVGLAKALTVDGNGRKDWKFRRWWVGIGRLVKLRSVLLRRIMVPIRREDLPDGRDTPRDRVISTFRAEG